MLQDQHVKNLKEKVAASAFSVYTLSPLPKKKKKRVRLGTVCPDWPLGWAWDMGLPLDRPSWYRAFGLHTLIIIITTTTTTTIIIIIIICSSYSAFPGRS